MQAEIERSLMRGDKGLAVAFWNKFLINCQCMGRNSYNYESFDIFGVETEEATKKYQRIKDLNDSGILDSDTYCKAVEEGLVDGFIVEKAIISGLNRISGFNTSFEVSFSGKADVTFNIPSDTVNPGMSGQKTAKEAIVSFRDDFIG